MKVQTLWERLKTGMDDGFDAAITAVHNLTEKAGEGIELTRLRREKARTEAQLTRLLAELGHAVYQKISKNELDNSVVDQLGITDLIAVVADKEKMMIHIDRRLDEVRPRTG